MFSFPALDCLIKRDYWLIQLRMINRVTNSGWSVLTSKAGHTTLAQPIDLSVSPSPRTQTSQWQSSISCTRSGTLTSLGFSSIEKHRKMQSSHRFYGVYASKVEKLCAWGTFNTDYRYPERMGNIIIVWNFLNPNKIEKTVPKYLPQYKWRQKLSFSGCHTLIKLQFSSTQAER